MQGLEIFVRIVDGLNEHIGRVVAWFTLGCVLVCFTVVVLRYIFAIGMVWLQELYVWQHAVVLMVGAGYTLLRGGHVKVDIFYGRLSPRRQAWINILGFTFFLMPFAAVVAWYSQQFILSSWTLLEGSRNESAGGLPGAFLLKTVIWVFCLLIFLQGLAHTCRCFLFLSGREEYAPERQAG